MGASKGSKRTIVHSDTKQEFNGKLYYKCGRYFSRSANKGEKRLHRIVWEYHKGKIKDGMQIHHVDEDTSSNDIENLDIISASDHTKLHAKSESRMNHARQLGKKYQHRTKEWHGSPDGLQWHKQHYQKTKDAMHIKTIRECSFCSNKHETEAKKEHAFCSNKCKTAYRRESVLDNESRECIKCARKFQANKYSTRKNCFKCSPAKSRSRLLN